MKEKQKSYEKGITLIALVITIIVLLILAGVTLSIVFNGGIINKSQTAVDKYTEESAREKLSVAVLSYKMGILTGEAGEEDGKKTFKQYVEETGGELKETTDTTYKVRLDGYDFIIKRDNYEVISNGQTSEEIKYTITFDANGGTADITTKEVIKNSEYGELPIPKKAGYTFEGWYTAITDGERVTGDMKVTKDQTLYAIWNNISITFSKGYNVNKGWGGSNGGSFVTSAEIPKGCTIYYEGNAYANGNKANAGGGKR